jgi:hypothetical protein
MRTNLFASFRFTLADQNDNGAYQTKNFLETFISRLNRLYPFTYLI